jgi:CRISPR-associated protein Csb2
VVRAQPLRTTDVDAYAHRVNNGAVVRPYTAVLWLGDLAGPQTVAAIGQSRHLGGGLLVPYDLREGVRA